MNERIKMEVMKFCERRNLSENRKARYRVVFREINQLRINLENITINDMDKYFFYLTNSEYKEWTKFTKWKIFTKICRFIEADKKIDFSQYCFKEPDIEPEILSTEEIYRMVTSARRFEDRLIILLLFESGIRLGELLSIKKENVMFDDNGIIIHVSGKTGSRPVRIIKCMNILKIYVKSCFTNKIFNRSGRSIEEMIHNVAKKAGINRSVSPKLFRHTSATFYAKHLTEPEMRIRFGWSRNSKMPSYYSHLSSRDIDNKILAINGIKPQETKHLKAFEI